jgi:[acyl-carrier-protein] S-malonyltransferase
MAVAWLFPGQGTQVVGMSKDLAASSEAARRVWEETDEVLGERLSRLAFEGPLEELTLTANAQPAIVAASIAALAALRERLPQLPAPDVAAGHSLGEYSALVAAGALRLRDAVKLTRARGKAMQAAVPPGVGAMAAIMGLDAEAIEEICEAAAEGQVVCAANFNATGQIVIAGHAEAVKRACELAAGKKGKAVPLNVSAPFHSPLMAPAAKVVEAELRNVEVRAPSFPIVANVDARANADGAAVKILLTRQVDGAVRWTESVITMQEMGVTHALEIGPGKVLAGLTRRTAKQIRVLSVGDVASLDGVPAFLDLPVSTGSSYPPPTGGTMPPPPA